MLNPKDLQTIRQMIQNAIEREKDSTNQTVKNLQQEVCNLQEDSEITRFSVNLLLDWAEDASIQNVPIHSQKEKDDSSL